MKSASKEILNNMASNVVQLFRDKSPLSLPEEDQKATAEAYELLKLSEFSNSILAVIGFSCSSISYDIEFSPSLDNGQVYPIVSIAGSLSTFLLLLSIIWRTNCILQWEKGRGLYSSFDTLTSSEKLKGLLFELSFNALHPMWFFKNILIPSYNSVFKVTIYYHLNDLLTVAEIFRIYHLIRLYSVFSKYRTERAYRICKNNGKFAGTSWAIKSLMNDDPIKVTMAMMLSGLFIGSFCFRVFERPLEADSGQDFSDYGNCMWLVLVTMTTVGYGDFYPSTLPGRIIGLVICIWGVLVISIMVITVNNTLKLEKDEEKALALYKRLDLREDLRNTAGAMLFCALRYKRVLRLFPGDSRVKNIAFCKFQRSVRAFQEVKMRKKVMYKLNSAEDNIERRVNTISQQAKKYSESVDQIKAGLEGILCQ